LICGRCRSSTARHAGAVGKRAESWIALTNGVIGEGRALYRAVVNADLEGIVAKHLDDVYHPKPARWQKVLNRSYSQRHGRAEWFRERQGSSPVSKLAKCAQSLPSLS
jgi:hypothetical protein